MSKKLIFAQNALSALTNLAGSLLKLREDI